MIEGGRPASFTSMLLPEQLAPTYMTVGIMTIGKLAKISNVEHPFKTRLFSVDKLAAPFIEL